MADFASMIKAFVGKPGSSAAAPISPIPTDPEPNTSGMEEVVDPYDISDTNSQSYKDIFQEFEDKRKLGHQLRQRFEREWMWNILMYAGLHWYIWDNDRSTFRPKRMPPQLPAVIVNKFAEKANDLVSAIVQGRVAINYIPANDSPAASAVADIADTFRKVLYGESGADDIEEEAARWIVLTGNGALHPYYDMDEKYGTTQLPLFTCQTCGTDYSATDADKNGMKCPDCSAGADFSTPLPAQGPDTSQIGQESAMPPPAGEMSPPSTTPPGQSPEELSSPPVGGAPTPPSGMGGGMMPGQLTDMGHTKEEPIGRFCTACLSPFEYLVDQRIRAWKNHKWFIRMQMVDVKDAKEENPNTPVEITPDKDQSLSQTFLDALAFISPMNIGSPDGMSFSAGSNDADFPRVIKYTIFRLPSKKWPEGLKAVQFGKSGPIVSAEPLPDKYGAGPQAGQPFLPLSPFGFDTVPGRWWKKTRMSDLVQIQIYLNTILSIIKYTTIRMGNSVWLNPTGSGTTLIGGEPGQIIPYTPVSLGGTTFAKPERIPPELEGLQPLIIVANKLEDEMEKVAGTFFLTGGTTPPGVSAASALNLLNEKAQQAIATFRRSWIQSWLHWEEMGLEIFRAHANDKRKSVAAGRNKKWKMETFDKADLEGEVSMVPDTQSMIVKSMASTRATVTQLIQLGVLNAQDPMTNYKILEVFGETALQESNSLDEQQATEEWERFLDSGEVPQIMPLVDNSAVHIRYHADAAKTSEFRDLSPQLKQQWIDHINLHYQDVMARQSAFSPAGGPQGAPDENAPGPNAGKGGKKNAPNAAGPVESAGAEAGQRKGTQGLTDGGG